MTNSGRSPKQFLGWEHKKLKNIRKEAKTVGGCDYTATTQATELLKRE